MLAFDVESALTSKGNQAPLLACVSYATADHTGLLPYHATEWRDWFARGEVTGFHVAYDCAVLCANFPESVPLIFDAYEADRVTCTLARAKLLDIAFGKRKRNHGQYNLDDVAQRTLGVRVDKESPWRLRFGELRDTPLEWWPAEAKAYALTDARVTYDLWAAQEQYAHLLKDQYRQTRAAFALHLMSVWGITTDPDAIDRLEYHTRQRLESLIGDVKAAGLIRPDRVLKSGPRKGQTLPGTRDTKAAEARIVAAYAPQGREFRAKGRNDPRVFPYPPTNSGAPCLDFVACLESGDPILEKYAYLKKAQKTLGTDVPLLRAGTIHPFVDTLIDTGRTSMSPNLQNLPTGRQSKLPPFVGVRECFVPRAGCVYVACDYSGLELCTFAQICLDLFGFSRVAEELNAGIDSHSIIGARIRGISYEEGIARKKANNEDFDLARQCGKVCFHPDTEVLTRHGWIYIADLAPDEPIATPILLPNRKVEWSFQVPLALTRREATELIHLQNESIDLRVTPDHRMAGWKRSGAIETRLAAEYLGFGHTPHAGIQREGIRPVTRRFLRLLAAVQADGSYSSAHTIRFGFTKARKIRRMHWLLSGFEYTTRVSSQGATEFKLHGAIVDLIKLWMPAKCLTWSFMQFDYASRLTVAREARFWDGHDRGVGWSYCSTQTVNRDVMQALCVSVGYKASITGNLVQVKPRLYSRGGNVQIIRSDYHGLVYCVQTRTDLVLVRSGGKTVITHQCNFGKPGGMGAQALVFHAKKNYGVELTLGQSRELCDVWSEERPESGPYFAYINNIVNAPGLSQLPQVRCDRIRGGASYTEACNSLFQGLGGDVAKMAGWLLAREMYTDHKSPLWGCRAVNFVHDEWILECPEARAVAAAKRLSEVMLEAARHWLPDVKVKAVPLITRRWCKSAVSLGSTPWEPTMVTILSTACEETVAKAIRAVAKGRPYELREKAYDPVTHSRAWDVVSQGASLVSYGTVTVTPFGRGYRVAYESL